MKISKYKESRKQTNEIRLLSLVFIHLKVDCYFDSTFNKKAPKAIKEIKKFAQKAMGTTDVRVDVKLNKYVWSHGIRSVPLKYDKEKK